MEDLLLLDSEIRDWVLIPIVLVMLITSILRHHMTEYLKSTPKSDLAASQDGSLLMYSAMLRSNGGVLPPASFEARRATMTRDDGVLAKKAAVKVDPMNNPALDPSNMMNMMKGNMAMMVPQIALMSWISFFFAGFILVKFPFPLTLRFKLMFQQGIDLQSLDPSYVSSISWYFLNVFGLRGLLYIILGEGNAADDAELMKQQMGAGAPQTPDKAKLFASEKDNLALVEHEWLATKAEQRLFTRISNSGIRSKSD